MTEISNHKSWLSKKELRTCLDIFIPALVIRLIYLHDISASPTFLTPIVDPAEYHRLAQSLAGGMGMSPSFFWQGFFYPLFLSGIYFLSGASIVCAKIFQVFLGSVVCVLVYRLGKKIFDHKSIQPYFIKTKSFEN